MSDRVTVKSITPLARGWGRLDRYEVDHIRQDGNPADRAARGL